MSRYWTRRPFRLTSVFLLATGMMILGCQAMMKTFSSHLTNWKMLGDEALEDPIKAVGGSAFVFVPPKEISPLSRQQLASAPPEVLITYYSPVFVQQRADPQKTKYPYPPEIDMIGEAHLRRTPDGKLKSYVAGNPVVYAIYEEHIIPDHKPKSKTEPLAGRKHVQLTYTAWYPGHPKMKFIDVEEADIDSCVVRITLDADNAPLFYETIAACGCFHKIFVQRSIEEAAHQHFGPPEPDHKFCVEHSVPNSINWDVGGVIDEPHDRPSRPVIFLKAGDHKVIGVGSTARLRMPPPELQQHYDTTSYDDLKMIVIDNTQERDGFFDMDNGGKVRGGERKKEKFLFSFIGVDDAGHPRDVNQIKMHFDQSTWSDPTIYCQFLRLPPGTL